MSYTGWIQFNEQELVNVSRTAQLARSLNIDSVFTDPDDVAWIQSDLGGTQYDDVTQAPWWDEDYVGSGQFAGLLPLSFSGLDSSTLTSTPTEYVTDGGNSGKPRNATLPIVASVAIIASTEAGAEYGLRWMNRLLRDTPSNMFCSGGELRYFRFGQEGSPQAHRRNVRITRGTSVTRKRTTDCSVTWLVTFTLTAADPFEYSDAEFKVGELGGVVTGSPISDGSTVLIQEGCPEFDFTPIQDPLYPSLITPPAIPDFLPDGWDIVDGDTFERFWARVSPMEPAAMNVVPIFVLSTATDARMIRVSIWPEDYTIFDQCDPLFSAVIKYLPADLDLYIDGEQQAVYVWDGVSANVRRADGLVFGPDANPIDWSAFNDPNEYLVTLDVFADSSGYEGDGDVRAALSLVSKSD